MIWVFAIACGTCGVIGMAAGWIGRGSWDKAGRIIERTAAELPQRDRPLFSQDDWDQLDRLVNGGGGQ